MFQIFRLSGCKRAISGRRVQKGMVCFTMLLHCYFGKALYFPLVSCRLVWYSKEKGKPQRRPTLRIINKLSRYKRQAVNYSR